MSYILQNDALIKNEMSKLKSQVLLMLFTDFKTLNDGTKRRNCLACERILNLLSTLEKYTDGKLKIEEYSIEEQKELAEKYNVNRIPTIIFVNEKDEKPIRYIAEPAGSELVPFITSIQYFSGLSSFYKDTIKTNLKKVPKSSIKLFITQNCPYCPNVVPIVNLFASLSNGKVTSEIIDVDANPDMAEKYQISGVPHAIINEKDHIYGMFTLQDLLDKLTRGERDFGGMYA